MSGPTYSEQLQKLTNQYRDGGNPWPATMRQVAAWAIQESLWKPQRSTLIDRLAEDLARALREEYITDAQGRTVRAKHAARTKKSGENLTLWDDIRSAPREHMQMALQQRRQQIVGDCRQLKTDADSYNENTNPGPQIVMVFDFTDDLAELEAMDRLDP